MALYTQHLNDLFTRTEAPTFLWENIEEKAQYRYYEDKLDQDTFNRLVNLNKKLSRWIVEMYIKERDESRNPARFEERFWEDEEFWRQYFKDYQEFKQRNILPSQYKDINKIKSFEELKNLVLDYRKEAEEEEDVDEAEYRKIYDKNGWLVVVPDNVEAACKYGAGTQWCTAATNNNMFDRYARDGELYIIIDKNNNRKWQFHPASGQYMDERDNEITLSEYITFPHPLTQFLDQEGYAPFSTKLVDFAQDAEAMELKDWRKKYTSYFEQEPQALVRLKEIVANNIDWRDVDLTDVMSSDMEVQLVDMVSELLIHNSEVIDIALQDAASNPEYFLDNEPKEDENEDGVPVYSDEQLEKAQEIAIENAVDGAVDEEMREIKRDTLWRIHKDTNKEIAAIILNAELWDTDFVLSVVYDFLKWEDNLIIPSEREDFAEELSELL